MEVRKFVTVINFERLENKASSRYIKGRINGIMYAIEK